jgi:hypothetical protein
MGKTIKRINIKNMKFKIEIAFLSLSIIFLESCSVIYKAPYYVPNDSQNWTYEDRLNEYTHPRHFMSFRKFIQNTDTVKTQITFNHIRSNFGSGAKAKWVGFILPIIPQISFNRKREKMFNSEMEINVSTTTPIDTSKVSIIFNEKYLQKPNKSELISRSKPNGFYHYSFYLHIQSDEVLRKMESIKINTGEPKMKWLNDVIFIRKSRSVWCMFEGVN